MFATNYGAVLTVPLLKPCVNKPNCVSSVEARPNQHVEPYKIPPHAKHNGVAFTSTEVFALLLEEIKALPRTSIVTANEHYIHVEVRSRWFKFVDDLECVLVPEQSIIHFRSGARVGYADFGVNRKRVQKLHQALQNKFS